MFALDLDLAELLLDLQDREGGVGGEVEQVGLFGVQAVKLGGELALEEPSGGFLVGQRGGDVLADVVDERLEPDWIDVWLTQQLQDDPADLAPDSPSMVTTTIEFLEPFEPSFDLLKDLTGVSRISSLRADDGAADGDPYIRAWRLRHAMQGLHHGAFDLPWFRAARLVHAARLWGLKVKILPSGVGSPAVPDEIELGSLGLPESLVAELHERGVRNVGQLRQMPKRALQLDFLSTVLADVRGLRGEAPVSASGAAVDRREFTLNPWELLPAEAGVSLQLAAQAEVQRRLDARLPPGVVSGGDQTTLEWVQEVRAIEHRRIRAELAVRADEVLELLHCF